MKEKQAYFQEMLNEQPHHNQADLKSVWLDSPLGPMLAVADDHKLYLLEFLDCRGLKKEINRLRNKLLRNIVPGRTTPIDSIESELQKYFKGTLKAFKTPLATVGTHFQNRVWEELMKIPYGKTCSYAEIAKALGKPTAYRAVALANGSNQLSIIIPCHRVIKADGNLCGYDGGVEKKKWLLELEGGLCPQI